MRVMLPRARPVRQVSRAGRGGYLQPLPPLPNRRAGGAGCGAMTTRPHLQGRPIDAPLSAADQHTATVLLQRRAILDVVAAYEAFSEPRRPDQTDALHQRLYASAEALAQVVTDPETAVAEAAG